jgi:hypothetical protein
MFSTEARGASTVVIINAGGKQLHLFPNVGKYYDVPFTQLEAYSNSDDPNCAKKAGESFTFQREESVLGHRSLVWFRDRNGARSTDWLFPEIGCAIGQSIEDFGTEKSITILTSLQAGFSDLSVLQPHGVNRPPFEVWHDAHIANLMFGARRLTQSAAETDWNLMKTKHPAQMAMWQRTETSWEVRHGIKTPVPVP